MFQVLKILVSGLFGLMFAYSGLWAWKTMTIATPTDQVWMELNTRMPLALRAWACEQVQTRTQTATPPEGCPGRV